MNTDVTGTKTPTFDVNGFRRLFPIFAEQRGVYLDSAATTLTPEAVIEAETRYYARERAPVGRSDYRAALAVTGRVEVIRESIAESLHLPEGGLLIFCPGTTAALNLTAQAVTWKCGDNVVTTAVEHSSNFLPWLRLRQMGVEVRVARPREGVRLSSADILPWIDAGTRLVTVSQLSNVTGEGPQIAEISAGAHRQGALCVVDGAQAFGHVPVDLAELGCDVYAVSGHKAYGPTGTGFLALSPRALDQMSPPWVGGGMVETLEGLDYSAKPGAAGWEPGTPNIGGILGLGASLPVRGIAVSSAAVAHVQDLVSHAVRELAGFPAVTLISSAASSSIVSFSIAGHRPHRVSCYLDETAHVMLRAGLMCAIPLYQDLLSLPYGSLRLSLAPYNTLEEIDIFLQALRSYLEKYAKICGRAGS